MKSIFKTIALLVLLLTMACGIDENNQPYTLPSGAADLEGVDEKQPAPVGSHETISITINRFSPPRGIAFDSAATDLGEDELDLFFDGCRGAYTMAAIDEGGVCAVENSDDAFALGADPSQCDWNTLTTLAESTSVVVDRTGENYFLMEIVEVENDQARLTLNIRPLRIGRCAFLVQ